MSQASASFAQAEESAGLHILHLKLHLLFILIDIVFRLLARIVSNCLKDLTPDFSVSQQATHEGCFLPSKKYFLSSLSSADCK